MPMSVKQIDPKQTYDTLQKDPNAIYLDVRTRQNSKAVMFRVLSTYPSCLPIRCREE